MPASLDADLQGKTVHAIKKFCEKYRVMFDSCPSFAMRHQSEAHTEASVAGDTKSEADAQDDRGDGMEYEGE
jgi:hypothetical protein